MEVTAITVRRLFLGLSVLASIFAFGSSAHAVTATPGTTFAVSWLKPAPGEIFGSNSGSMGMGFSLSPMSKDGRYVLFASMSDNLVDGNDPNAVNLFRKDMQTGDIVMVNRLNGTNGAPIPGFIYDYAMSSDGNRVVFTATDKLTPDDLDEEADAYVRNIQAGTTSLVTPGTSEPVFEADISGDGAFIVFTTVSPLVAGDVNGLADVYRRNLSNGTIEIVSRIPALPNAGNSDSNQGVMSDDGRWVAFASRATNLIAGFTDNSGAFSADVFVRDMTGGTTYLVSSRFNSSTQGGNDGSDEPDIAGSPAAINDVKVAFSSYANDLADNAVTDTDTSSSVYLKEMPGQASELVSRATGPAGANADSRAHTPSISDNASRIVFSSDATNLGAGADYYGVYLRDLTSSATSLVSAKNNYAVQGTISGNGSSATWTEAGGGTPDSDPDLSGVFRRNLNTDAIRFVSRPNGSARVVAPGFSNYALGDSRRALSANGRYIVFGTASSHLPGGDTATQKIYRRDLATGKIELVSRANGANGAVSEGDSPSISGDGNLVAFLTWDQLDPGDTNDKSDVYVRNLSAGTTTLASRADGPAGVVADGGMTGLAISADGSSVAFSTDSTNLGAPGGDVLVYVRDLDTNTTTIASRATGVAGALANNDAEDPMLSGDGSRVVFASNATNLSPDDASSSRSMYVRDRTTNETILVSREPGLAGTSIPSFTYDHTINADGTKVAFATLEDAAVPATAPWPVSEDQLVVRTIADGSNVLGSSSPGGVVGDSQSEDPSLNADGSVLAFATSAGNIRTDLLVNQTDAVVIKDLTSGATSGPPLFGNPQTLLYGARFPQISDNGNCVLFGARGHNAVSGHVGDFESTYIFVRSGTCQDPEALVPKLTSVALKPAKFRVAKKATAKVAAKKKAPRGTKIRFSLNTKAKVTIRIDQKLKGRKVGKKCVKPTAKNRARKACKRLAFRGKLTRKNLVAGKRTVAFSGRIGSKALKPGKYRVVLQAFGPGGQSAKVYRSFKVVKR